MHTPTALLFHTLSQPQDTRGQGRARRAQAANTAATAQRCYAATEARTADTYARRSPLPVPRTRAHTLTPHRADQGHTPPADK